MNSTSTSQVAEDTVSLLMAMGMEAHAYPSSTPLADWTTSEAGAELQRWKRKLKTAFGSKDVGTGRQPVARSTGERVNPASIPLPRTPKKITRAVFGSTEQSPYFHASHMVTPRYALLEKRSKRSRRRTLDLALGEAPLDVKRPRTTRLSDAGNLFYQDDDVNDARPELAWQIRELTAMEEMDPTTKFEIAQHRPLGKITPFRGKLDESESSMQWLRGLCMR
ncbi:Eukaryotic/viral aspartic protease [Phytophthora megakarya]|uniref:Eukaryotic/viral aspartic protease n=1 Tax=Phytophthora megakarya TaxID=4795 RepID=A0A225URQ7_9STRA|nr:Eukaryotic/viral aspartic protease [Phytophthora megakarya]